MLINEVAVICNGFILEVLLVLAAGTALVARPTHPDRAKVPTKAITNIALASNLPALAALQ